MGVALWLEPVESNIPRSSTSLSRQPGKYIWPQTKMENIHCPCSRGGGMSRDGTERRRRRRIHHWEFTLMCMNLTGKSSETFNPAMLQHRVPYFHQDCKVHTVNLGVILIARFFQKFILSSICNLNPSLPVAFPAIVNSALITFFLSVWNQR